MPKVIYSHSEAERVINLPNIDSIQGIRDRAILELFYSTGIRRQELVDLSLSDIDYERGAVFVHEGKGLKDRLVPIGDRALRWLKKYVKEYRDHLVVPGQDPFDPETQRSSPEDPPRTRSHRDVAVVVDRAPRAVFGRSSQRFSRNIYIDAMPYIGMAIHEDADTKKTEHNEILRYFQKLHKAFGDRGWQVISKGDASNWLEVVQPTTPGTTGEPLRAFIQSYPNPSRFGIDAGRVSRLDIRSGQSWLYNYDRGLDFDELDGTFGARAFLRSILAIAN